MTPHSLGDSIPELQKTNREIITMSKTDGTNGEQYSPLYYNLLADERLTITHAALYGLIWSLTERGHAECYAGNTRFCDMLNLKTRAVSGLLERLEECGYIKRRYEYEGKKISKRYIRVLSMQQDAHNENQYAMGSKSVCTGTQVSMQQNAELIDNLIDNKIDNKVISKNSYNFLGESYLKGDTPTVDQVIGFYKSTGNGLNCKSNAEYFHAYWTEKDWKRGSKTVQWPKTLNTWIASSKARGR
mgnify:FL=1